MAKSKQEAQASKTLGVPGRLRAVAKLALEEVLWARVALSERVGAVPALPERRRPTDVLSTPEQYERAVTEAKRLRLPTHFDRPKNWDVLGAVSVILHELGSDIRVLDAGAARYSTVLTSLAIYRVRELVGNNLEFGRVRQHSQARFEFGDVTDLQYRDDWFDAITCLSVIEHGVPLEGFLAESARVLRPGGLLVVSTDYAARPPDVTGKTAYGVPVHIFDPDDIRDLVAAAARHGLELVGELALEHEQNVVHWKRLDLDYTFIMVTFRKVG